MCALVEQILGKIRPTLSRRKPRDDGNNQGTLIASVGHLPYMSICESLEGSQVSEDYPYSHCTGVEPELLKIFAKHLNVTAKFLPLVNEPWGSMQPNGSWNGHIGRILRGQADLAVGSITPTHARFRVVDFTPIVAEDHYVFTVPGPGEMPKFLAFVRPFSQYTWLFILLTTLAVAMADFAFTKASPRTKASGNVKQGFVSKVVGCGSNLVNLIKSLLYLTTESMEFRGAGVLAVIPPCRTVLLAVWLAMSSFIGRIYSAVILAYLITPALVPGIETLEDAVLTSNGRFVTTKLDGASMEYIMATGSDRVSSTGGDNRESVSGRRMLFRKILDQDRLLVCDIPGALEALECGSPDTDFLICSLRYAENLVAKSFYLEGKRVHFAKEIMLPSSFAWPIAKGNPLAPKLTAMMNQAKAAGLIAELSKREKMKFFRGQYGGGGNAGSSREGAMLDAMEHLRGGGRQSPDDEELRILGMGEFLGVVFVIGIGFALSIIVFLVEVAMGRQK